MQSQKQEKKKMGRGKESEQQASYLWDAKNQSLRNEVDRIKKENNALENESK
jgi:hypothetical protein